MAWWSKPVNLPFCPPTATEPQRLHRRGVVPIESVSEGDFDVPLRPPSTYRVGAQSETARCLPGVE
jgi:hypothetical protein